MLCNGNCQASVNFFCLVQHLCCILQQAKDLPRLLRLHMVQTPGVFKILQQTDKGSAKTEEAAGLQKDQDSPADPLYVVLLKGTGGLAAYRGDADLK